MPWPTISWAGMPSSRFSQRMTATARACDSFRLYSSLPSESVCPNEPDLADGALAQDVSELAELRGPGRPDGGRVEVEGDVTGEPEAQLAAVVGGSELDQQPVGVRGALGRVAGVAPRARDLDRGPQRAAPAAITAMRMEADNAFVFLFMRFLLGCSAGVASRWTDRRQRPEKSAVFFPPVAEARW